MARRRYTPEEREQVKQEIIAEVTALSVAGVGPTKSEMGDTLYSRALYYFKTMSAFWEAAGLKPPPNVCRRPPALQYQKGALRKVLGAYDVLDHAERGA